MYKAKTSFTTESGKSYEEGNEITSIEFDALAADEQANFEAVATADAPAEPGQQEG